MPNLTTIRVFCTLKYASKRFQYILFNVEDKHEVILHSRQYT